MKHNFTYDWNRSLLEKEATNEIIASLSGKLVFKARRHIFVVSAVIELLTSKFTFNCIEANILILRTKSRKFEISLLYEIETDIKESVSERKKIKSRIHVQQLW